MIVGSLSESSCFGELSLTNNRLTDIAPKVVPLAFAINALNNEEHPLDMYQVSRLLGHASTETTEKVYADYITSTLREKMTDLGFDFLPELVG